VGEALNRSTPKELIMTTIDTTPDLVGLARAIESRDADEIIARYAEDATLTVLDRDHPPSNPQVFVGCGPIGEYFREVCGRNIEHEVKDAVGTPTGLAFTQHCRYPDGARVVCATVATVRDGLIHRQTVVQTWDG
jgi:hypothetical protein